MTESERGWLLLTVILCQPITNRTKTVSAMDPPEAIPEVSHPRTLGDPITDGLHLSDVKRLASEENYEVIYFSRESGLISFEPSKTFHNGTSDDIYYTPNVVDGSSKEDVRINVYYTTGTVGTCFTHPTRGSSSTQLFRRNVGLRRLIELFRDPHAPHTEHDSAYFAPQDATYQSPADLSAADVLQQTNQMLREQLENCQRVEVTGPRGMPVYASGTFCDGKWVVNRVGELWECNLNKVAMVVTNDDHDEDKGTASTDDEDGAGEECMRSVPITALADLEIRLGGVLYASAYSHTVHAQMDDQEWDNDSGKEVICHFGGPVTGVWLPIRISGWDKRHWSMIQSRDFARRQNDYRDNLNVFDILLEEVAETFPDATVSFGTLSFFGEVVEQMVDNLGLDTAGKKSKEGGDANNKDGEKEELWNIANLIVQHLRGAGNDDVGDAFMKRVNDLQMAAYMLLSINNESTEMVEEELPSLVQMQLESKSTADFLAQVQVQYQIMSSFDGGRGRERSSSRGRSSNNNGYVSSGSYYDSDYSQRRRRKNGKKKSHGRRSSDSS